jgi:hypothetical protein
LRLYDANHLGNIHSKDVPVHFNRHHNRFEQRKLLCDELSINDGNFDGAPETVLLLLSRRRLLPERR